MFRGYAAIAPSVAHQGVSKWICLEKFVGCQEFHGPGPQPLTLVVLGTPSYLHLLALSLGYIVRCQLNPKPRVRNSLFGDSGGGPSISHPAITDHYSMQSWEVASLFPDAPLDCLKNWTKFGMAGWLSWLENSAQNTQVIGSIPTWASGGR